MVPFMPALNPTPTFLAWPELPTQGWRAWWRPRCAVGEEIELAFLDPVLHLAAGAADRLAEIGARNFPWLERGDDEAGVGFARSFNLQATSFNGAPSARLWHCIVGR